MSRDSGKPKATASDHLARLDFAGWGTAERIDDLGEKPVGLHPVHAKLSHLLGPWKATAICGNDITSSTLYVAALCALQAGPLAPLALAIVAAALYAFRGIYAEVGSALPLNGGAYNVLLNTTSKAKASIAACLTILSYIATAVLSANEAVHYAENYVGHVDVLAATLGLLGFFALLNIIGISESANVALGIFVFHIVTLSVLVILSAWAVIQNPGVLAANLTTPPSVGWSQALFFGFAAAMLGISGFESSANFIEEQQPGVFVLTLRNMWVAVAFFNPVISLLALGLVPLANVAEHQTDLLAHMGNISGGGWLQQVVSIDATLVLAGAVLTSFVGVTGLIRRMSLDRCLPQFLLTENPWRRTNHWIILLFLALCASILLLSSGSIETLAGVYTLSFLSVMALFAIGNIMLKLKRDRLPRDFRATSGALFFGLTAVAVGLAGNLLLNPEYVRVFAIYFAVSMGVVALMLYRIQILGGLLLLAGGAVRRVRGAGGNLYAWVLHMITDIRSRRVVYFTRGDNLETLNRAALYVLENEITNNMMAVHCYMNEADITPSLAENLRIIDRMYPRLKIDLVLVHGAFTPELIEKLSQRLKVPKNYMFISTPGNRFPHNLGDLGGVRLIM